MSLKSQDVVALGALLEPPADFTYQDRSIQFGMSVSEVHAADKRLLSSGLMNEGRPVVAALEEFLVHGLRYVFVPKLEGLVRGVPTAHAGPGLSFSPLYSSVLGAARRDPKLHELHSLADALRGGRARERKLAAELIHQCLSEGAYAL